MLSLDDLTPQRVLRAVVANGQAGVFEEPLESGALLERIADALGQRRLVQRTRRLDAAPGEEALDHGARFSLTHDLALARRQRSREGARPISELEGGFDTINTYDKATLTWGFVQWTGGSKSDLVKAMTIIKEQFPDGFARAFQKYGVDIEGKNLVITMPDGTRFEGDEAAEAIMKNPKLGAAMVHAGRDPDVQKGEVKAGEEIEIDTALSKMIKIGDKEVATRTIVTSEYGVGLLANTFVHSGPGPAHKAINKAIEKVRAKHPYVAGDAGWAEKAEAAIIVELAATDADRSVQLNAKLDSARGSFKP